MLSPARRNGIALERLQQGSFFTREGKLRIPGAGSTSTPGELLNYLVRMEQGRLVDPFSSLEIKKLLYLTDQRIRYASSPALDGAAVYFKSGSLFRCQPEPGFTCKPYQGNVLNLMHSVAVVEAPSETRRQYYLVVLMSDVLRKNSAVVHQSIGTNIQKLMEKLHPAAPVPAAPGP